MAQWLRVCLPVQGIWVPSFAGGANIPHATEQTSPEQLLKPECPEPVFHSKRSQLLKPECPEPVFHSKRSHHSEKPTPHN